MAGTAIACTLWGTSALKSGPRCFCWVKLMFSFRWTSFLFFRILLFLFPFSNSCYCFADDSMLENCQSFGSALQTGALLRMLLCYFMLPLILFSSGNRILIQTSRSSNRSFSSRRHPRGIFLNLRVSNFLFPLSSEEWVIPGDWTATTPDLIKVSTVTASQWIAKRLQLRVFAFWWGSRDYLFQIPCHV